MVTAVEKAVIALGEHLRNEPFGQYLHSHHPSRRGGDGPLDSLAPYELSGGSAIRRTFAVISLSQRAGEQLSWTDDDREYLEWVTRAWQAMKRIAAKCWAPIRSDIRSLVVDEDDLFPDETQYLPGARESGVGPWLQFCGLDREPANTLISELVAACRHTAAYNAAAECAARVAKDGVLRAEAVRRRQLIMGGLAIRKPELIGVAKNRRLDLVARAYESSGADVRQFAASVRGYNELINYVLWAVLGLAEITRTPKVSTSVDSIRARRRQRSLWVDFATLDPPDALVVAHPPAPFVMALGTPLDGLYIAEGNTVRWSGRELVDVHARRLRELEAAVDLMAIRTDEETRG